MMVILFLTLVIIGFCFCVGAGIALILGIKHGMAIGREIKRRRQEEAAAARMAEAEAATPEDLQFHDWRYCPCSVCTPRRMKHYSA